MQMPSSSGQGAHVSRGMARPPAVDRGPWKSPRVAPGSCCCSGLVTPGGGPSFPTCKMGLLFLILGLCPILCGVVAHLAIAGWSGACQAGGTPGPAEIMSPGLGPRLLFIYGDEGVGRGFCLGFGWKIIRRETTAPGEPNRPSPIKPPQHPDCTGGQSGTSSLPPGELGRFQGMGRSKPRSSRWS